MAKVISKASTGVPATKEENLSYIHQMCHSLFANAVECDPLLGHFIGMARDHSNDLLTGIAAPLKMQETNKAKGG